MTQWPVKPLGEVCEILDRLRKPITKKDRKAGEFPYYGATGVVDYVADYIFDEPLVLVGEDGAKWGAGDASAFPATGRYWVNNHAHVLRPDRTILLDEWLIYQLNAADLSEFIRGITVPKLNQERLREIPIPLPPLGEQRRIVAVLDETFAAIATATANAEKNLANARELFRSELTTVIDAGGDDWCELPLGVFCEMYQPQTIGRAGMVDDGPYPVFGANGIIGQYDRFNHAEPQLLVTCRGATCGSLNISAPNSWITGNAMVVRPRDGVLRLKLLMRIFEGAFDFSKVITGAAQPQITRQSFAPAKVKFPSKPDEQAQLESRFDTLQAATDALADVYVAKTGALSSLKQSLLHGAFPGELTQSDTETIAA